MTVEPRPHVRIILVRPRNPNNIGAAARAMANFGLNDLAVVEPFDPVWRETRSALDADAVMARARKLSWDEALSDCRWIIGTTTGRRRKPRRPMIALPELSGFLGQKEAGGRGPAALVFGSEKTGLRNRELDRCHALLRIPTLPSAPSMNLGQAVAVVAYELLRGEPAAWPQGPAVRQSPTAEQTEDFIENILRSVRALDYKRTVPDAVMAGPLRRSVAQWNMSRKDMALLQALLKRAVQRARRDPPQAAAKSGLC